jgi:hypothetical protein
VVGEEQRRVTALLGQPSQRAGVDRVVSGEEGDPGIHAAQAVTASGASPVSKLFNN